MFDLNWTTVTRNLQDAWFSSYRRKYEKKSKIFVAFRPQKIQHQPETITNAYNSYSGCLTSTGYKEIHKHFGTRINFVRFSVLQLSQISEFIQTQKNINTGCFKNTFTNFGHGFLTRKEGKSSYDHMSHNPLFSRKDLINTWRTHNTSTHKTHNKCLKCPPLASR